MPDKACILCRNIIHWSMLIEESLHCMLCSRMVEKRSVLFRDVGVSRLFGGGKERSGLELRLQGRTVDHMPHLK